MRMEIMTDKSESMSPAEQIAFWADKLRDLSATGLEYAKNSYDKTRYEIIQELAMEMLAFATGQPIERLLPLKSSVFSRMSPVVAGSAAVINGEGKILLMLRADNHLWAMPAGQMEVGETPAEAVVRETYEETGIRCTPKALVGVYDSRLCEQSTPHHVYKFTFLCEPVDVQSNESFDTRETLEIGWFAENNLPDDLYPGHSKRIFDSYQVRNGNLRAHFD
jgi:8-oxo-dGTP pyrophosphatase MutT (NUDIX family)